MKIGVLYICTGNYTVFWDDFYHSCEKNFLQNHQRFYFVFTDGQINAFDNPNVRIIYQEKLGWPFDTLKRFNMFLRIEDQLEEMDYLYFFNANIIVHQKVEDKDVFPSDNKELVVAQHPCCYEEKNPDKFPYDRNPDSLAFIPFGEGNVYVQGAFNGGVSGKFLQMCKIINENTELDLSRNVIALWHDESHLNKYILDKTFLLLNPGYIYPEGWKLPFEMKMYTRKKKKYGGHEKLRAMPQKKESILKRMIQIFMKRK